MVITVNVGLERSQNFTGSRTKGPVRLLEVVAAFNHKRAVLTDLRIVRSNTERTVVARVKFLDKLSTAAVRSAIGAVSVALDQDCIAWRDKYGNGSLTGPFAHAWGEFAPEYFIDLE